MSTPRKTRPRTPPGRYVSPGTGAMIEIKLHWPRDSQCLPLPDMVAALPRRLMEPALNKWADDNWFHWQLAEAKKRRGLVHVTLDGRIA